MRIGFIAVAIAALVAVVAVGTGSAATPVNVSFTGCVFGGGGNATVLAGSAVTVRIGWASKNRGRVQDFLNSQTTTVSFNGNPVANASSLWGPLTQQVDGSWSTRWAALAGTLASPGDQIVVKAQMAITHKVPDGKDPDTGKQIFAGPGNLFSPGFTTCTITAT
jgi:hypothetical protein